MYDNSLITGVEQEDECNDCVCGGVSLVESILSRADSLQCEEQKHSPTRGEEKETTTETVHEEGGENSPEQIPDGEDSGDTINTYRTRGSDKRVNLPVNEKLNSGVRDTDTVKHVLKVVRNETVTRPLREECNSDNDDHSSSVAGCGNESFPSDIGSDCKTHVSPFSTRVNEKYLPVRSNSIAALISWNSY